MARLWVRVCDGRRISLFDRVDKAAQVLRPWTKPRCHRRDTIGADVLLQSRDARESMAKWMMRCWCKVIGSGGWICGGYDVVVEGGGLVVEI